MKNKYFIDYLKSFAFGNPNITDSWKHLIFEIENQEYDVVAFRLPKRRSGELVISIEKMLQDRL